MSGSTRNASSSEITRPRLGVVGCPARNELRLLFSSFLFQCILSARSEATLSIVFDGRQFLTIGMTRCDTIRGHRVFGLSLTRLFRNCGTIQGQFFKFTSRERERVLNERRLAKNPKRKDDKRDGTFFFFKRTIIKLCQTFVIAGCGDIIGV